MNKITKYGGLEMLFLCVVHGFHKLFFNAFLKSGGDKLTLGHFPPVPPVSMTLLKIFFLLFTNVQ